MAYASDVFQADADGYDQTRRRLIPPYECFYKAAVDALDLGARPPKRVLDLGAGTGLLSERIMMAHPQAQLTLLDGAPAMLEQASKRLGSNVRCVVADLADPLPDGEWDAIVSALAIHHLDDQGKRALFTRIHEALPPDGIFVNAEQIAGPTAHLEQAYHRWHREAAARLGCEPELWLQAQRRMSLDRCSDLESQMVWLREAGFPHVDCLFKRYRFAVIYARRAQLTETPEACLSGTAEPRGGQQAASGQK
jgi:tRNA (cmo5U34)-methyltransferase